MLAETDPVRKKCSKCSGTMNHVRLFWKKIEDRMPCPHCRHPNARWI